MVDLCMPWFMIWRQKRWGHLRTFFASYRYPEVVNIFVNTPGIRENRAQKSHATVPLTILLLLQEGRRNMLSPAISVFLVRYLQRNYLNVHYFFRSELERDSCKHKKVDCRIFFRMKKNVKIETIRGWTDTNISYLNRHLLIDVASFSLLDKDSNQLVKLVKSHEMKKNVKFT